MNPNLNAFLASIRGFLFVVGGLLADDGTVISKFSGEGTPPKPVTVASAAEIVAAFAPPTASIAKT